jgi:hypothetical protein
MASQIDYIAKILKDELLWTTKEIDFEIDIRAIFKQEPFASYRKEIFEELGGMSEDLPITFTMPHLQCEDAYIVFNDSLAFNRYRTITFRSELYEDIPQLPLQNYRRFCRSNEKQCLASGTAGTQWTNLSAEYYFGESQDRGDLGIKGSAEWKKRAFEQFQFDLIAKAANKKVIYTSIYDVVMINGQLTAVEKLTLSQNELSAKYLWNYLRRLLGR